MKLKTWLQSHVALCLYQGQRNGGGARDALGTRLNHTRHILLHVPVCKVTAGLMSLPVNIAHLVYGVDGEDHFTGVEPGHLFRKVVLKLAEQRQDITTYIVVHHQVLGWGGGG